MRAFPPRLPDQPIFYPVTNEAYARQIARDWNTKRGTRAGFVKRTTCAITGPALSAPVFK